MAKITRAKKIEEEPIVMVTEPAEEILEEDVSEEEVSVVEELAPVPSKLVRIRARKNHNCHIGHEDYVLEKGKVYNVPENVRAILAKADLLLPL